MKTVEKATGLALLREPFPANQISYLPKGGVKLAYVGHAALTDRLLDADPAWSWEPLAVSANGLPALDEIGGLWIKLTVCGITRLGYGDAGDKKGCNAMKERIGDALRNAAMRFGAALDLWHKGDLHLDEVEPVAPSSPTLVPTASKSITASVFETMDAPAQEAMKNAAMSVFEAFEVSADVGFDEYQRIKSSYDADQQTAFWNLLGSKTRSSIKKTGEARKQLAA